LFRFDVGIRHFSSLYFFIALFKPGKSVLLLTTVVEGDRRSPHFILSAAFYKTGPGGENA
jgi:hypothetical protein